MPSAVNRSMTPFEWGLLIALSLLWGGSFFFVGVAVGELPPMTIVALRVSLAALALLAVVRIAGLRMPRDATAWRAFFVMSTINNLLPFCLIVWGQTRIESGLASILNATTPLFTVAVAHAFTSDEKMTGNRFVGVLVGIAGVSWMMGFDALSGLGGNIPAQFAILLASLSYAFAGVFGKQFNRMGLPPLVTAAGLISASSMTMIPLVLLAERPWTLPQPSTTTMLAILGLALLSTSLAYILYFRILATAGATNLLLVTFLIPVSAILLGTLVLGERLSVNHFTGMAIIGIGLAAIDGRTLDFLRRRIFR